MQFLQSLDDRLFFAINSFSRHTGWLHGVAEFYAKYGVVLFGLVLLAALTLARRQDSRTLGAAGWAPIATLVSLAVNQPISHAFHEARPYATHPKILRLVSRSADFSFPSDHTVMAGAVATGVFFVSRRLGLLAGAAAMLMAFTRVYVAAHYPWDVVAGLILGAVVTVAGWVLLRPLLTALAAWLRRQPGLRLVLAPRGEIAVSGTPVAARS